MGSCADVLRLEAAGVASGELRAENPRLPRFLMAAARRFCRERPGKHHRLWCEPFHCTLSCRQASGILREALLLEYVIRRPIFIRLGLLLIEDHVTYCACL